MAQRTTAGEQGADSGGPLSELRGRALAVVLGALVCQLGLGFGYVISPLAGEIIESFGWTRAVFSSARSTQLWVISLASPLVGVLVARLGARRVLIASVLVMSAVFVALSAVATLWQFTLCIALLGAVMVGFGDITVGQLVARWVTRARGLALGVVYTGSNLGGFVFIPYAVWVADAESWRSSMVHLGLASLLLLLPAAIGLVRERPASSDEVDDGEADRDSADLALSQALRTRSFWILAASLFTFFAYFLALLEHLVLFLTDTGMSRAEAASYLRWSLGMGVVSKVVLGLLADRIPHRTALLIDFGVLAASSVLLLVLPHPVLIWAFVVSFGFATAARDVVYPLIIIHCFGARHLAPIYGALMLAMAPGGSVGQIFAAVIHDTQGHYMAAFCTFVALNAVAVVALCFVRNERISTTSGGGRG